jgi:hypothetical protein
MASDLGSMRITDLVAASMRKSLSTELSLNDSFQEFVEKKLEEIGKSMGVKVELDGPLTPEQEAAARLDGTFDPNLLHFKVQVPVALEFIEMTFVIDPEKKDA